jgi:hypothetical protein
MRLGDLSNTIKTLLESKVKETATDFFINNEDESVILRKNVDVVIFLVVETVLLLIEQENKRVKVNISGNEKIVVSFEDDLIYDKEFAKKVVLLLTDVEGVKFTLKDKKAKIFIEN